MLALAIGKNLIYQKLFFKNEFEDKEYLCTGDIGFFDDAGELYIVGRAMDAIEINQEIYYPEKLELIVSNMHQLIRSGGVAFF